MIDVHVLTLPTDNPAWFEQCLFSLYDEPVHVYVRPGIDGDIGNARSEAFLHGDSEFVSFVDPDDYVLPGGFQMCLEQMRTKNLDAVYTYEIKTGISGEVLQKPYILTWAHHLIVFRRSLVISNLEFWRQWKWPSRLSEGRMFVDWLKKQNYSVGVIDKPYYVWRRHSDSYTVKYQTSVKNG